MPSIDDLVRLLEEEKQARQHAVAVVETQRRTAQAFDRLWAAAVVDATLDESLRRLIGLFVDVAHADAGVLRLRDGDRLRSRAAVGLDDEEVAAKVTFPMEEALAGAAASGPGALLLTPVAADAACWSEPLRDKGVRRLHRLPLIFRDSLVGVVYLGYLGMRGDGEPNEDDQHLLHALARRAPAAVARRTALDALQQAVRARDEVLAVVAHDLRNPIGLITLSASSLLQRPPDSPTRGPVERILRGAQRAERLIQDILDVSAIESGRFAIEKRTVHTADVILAAIESQQSVAASASVILASDLSPDLPPVHGDEERILEVLENLISNAVKFTGSGGTITVGASSEKNGEIVVWVRDTGCGIQPDHLPHLFDRFWQATKKDRRGIGLGLTIAKAIVEAHGGRIWVKSAVGVGTTMFFALPAMTRGSIRPDGVQVATVLLVDDRPENLVSLEAILERPEYRLLTATSGEEALRLVLREEVDLALIDIAMPGMNGFEVATHLKALERSRDIPILFITAFGDDPEEIHKAYSAGGVDYLIKPLDPEIVRKKVAVFIGLSRRRRSNDKP